MKIRLTLLALAALGFAAIGCDTAPKDDTSAPSSSVTKTEPGAPSASSAVPKAEAK